MSPKPGGHRQSWRSDELRLRFRGEDEADRQRVRPVGALAARRRAMAGSDSPSRPRRLACWWAREVGRPSWRKSLTIWWRRPDEAPDFGPSAAAVDTCRGQVENVPFGRKASPSRTYWGESTFSSLVSLLTSEVKGDLGTGRCHRRWRLGRTALSDAARATRVASSRWCGSCLAQIGKQRRLFATVDRGRHDHPEVLRTRSLRSPGKPLRGPLP